MTQNDESRYEREKRQLAMIAGCYKIDKQEIVVEKNHLDLLIKLANERNELLRERENAEVVYKQTDSNSMIKVGFWTESEIQERIPMIPTNVFDFQKGIWMGRRSR